MRRADGAGRCQRATEKLQTTDGMVVRLRKMLDARQEGHVSHRRNMTERLPLPVTNSAARQRVLVVDSDGEWPANPLGRMRLGGIVETAATGRDEVAMDHSVTTRLPEVKPPDKAHDIPVTQRALRARLAGAACHDTATRSGPRATSESTSVQTLPPGSSRESCPDAAALHSDAPPSFGNTDNATFVRVATRRLVAANRIT